MGFNPSPALGTWTAAWCLDVVPFPPCKGQLHTLWHCGTVALTGSMAMLLRAGRNDYGQVGDGTTTHRNNPTAVSGSHNFTHVSAGTDHTCGVRTDFTALCWGE